MTKHIYVFILIALFIPLSFSCKKDPKPPATRGVYRLCSNINPHYYEVHGTDTAYCYFPNIFTPNGDWLNDIFGVFQRGIDTLNCTIKDGAIVVCNSSDINDTLSYRYNGIHSLWNGLINNVGAPASENDYSVFITGVTIWGAKFTLNGTISLTKWDNASPIFINCDTCEFPFNFQGFEKGFVPFSNPLQATDIIPSGPIYHCN